MVASVDIFRDYGFIEQMPQRWYYTDQHYQFELDVTDDGGGQTYDVRWSVRPKNQEKRSKFVSWLKAETRRLRRLKNIRFPSGILKDVPGTERDLILDFVDANIVAMTAAIESLRTLDVSRTADDEPTCVASSLAVDTYQVTTDAGHYDPLDAEPDTTDREVYTCDTTDAFAYVGFDEEEFVETPYQDMKFMYKDVTDDVCLDLGTTVFV
jgi:hypothetical protein